MARVPRKVLPAFKKGHRVGQKDVIDDDLSYRLLKIMNTSKCEVERLEATKALEFYAQFNKEFERGSLSRVADTENRVNDLHSSDEERRLIYSRSNARTRDIMNRPFRVEAGFSRTLDRLLNADLGDSWKEEDFLTAIDDPESN
jgi:hypothetical protein